MADFSCYITIESSTDAPTLMIQGANINRGNFPYPPPQLLLPENRITVTLNDPSGPYGSDGMVTYGTMDRKTQLVITFACPYWTSNTGSVNLNSPDLVADWFAQSNNDGNWQQSNIPGSGHPLKIYVGIRSPSEPPMRPTW